MLRGARLWAVPECDCHSFRSVGVVYFGFRACEGERETRDVLFCSPFFCFLSYLPKLVTAS